MSGLPGAYKGTAEAGTRVKCLRHWGLRTWNTLQEVVHVVGRAGESPSSHPGGGESPPLWPVQLL